MTRAHFKRPVWTWFCDRCGKTSGDLATEQQGLPDVEQMRTRGWFIAETWGDRCSECGEVGWENNLARHRSKHARFNITPKEGR